MAVAKRGDTALRGANRIVRWDWFKEVTKPARPVLALILLLLLAACARTPVKPVSVLQPDAAAWGELGSSPRISTRAVLAWQSGNDEKGRNRVRLTLVRPDRLKLQWLTPWGSVAGQLLLVEDYFWLSDARKRQTWHGRIQDFGDCFQVGTGWSNSLRHLSYWPLLFTTPQEDAERFSGLKIDYLSRREQNRVVELAKVFENPAGESVRVVLSRFTKLSDGALWPQRLRLEGRRGWFELELKKPLFPSHLAAGTFDYKLQNFTLHDCGP